MSTATECTTQPTASPATAAFSGGEALSIRAKIVKVIEDIRPAVQEDGGDLEFVDVSDDGIVQVKLHGSCVGCPSSSAKLRVGIERYIVEEVPQVTSVVCV